MKSAIRTHPRWTVAAAVSSLVLGMAMLVSSPPVTAQGTFTISFCKRLQPQRAIYFELTYRQCSAQFTTGDAYVGIVVHLQNVETRTRVDIELLDPNQTSVWKTGELIDVTPGRYYPNLWIWAVLPISADPVALGSENPLLAARRIRVEGSPVMERVGEWVLNVRLDGGRPTSRKFTLQPAL